MIQLDDGGQDRPGAFERQGNGTAIGEPAEHGAVMRERVEARETVHARQLTHQRRQHRQQRHPLAVDLDAEIERKPPVPSLGHGSRPVAAAIDDAVAKPVLELDLPAVGFELRHHLV